MTSFRLFALLLVAAVPLVRGDCDCRDRGADAYFGVDCDNCEAGCRINKRCANLLFTRVCADNCIACGDGQFAPDYNNWNSCERWTNCPRGSRVTTQPTKYRNRGCAGCGPGKDSNKQNAPECYDINGCTSNSCAGGGDANAKCHDVSAPGTGYTCGCSSGWREQAGKCVDINSCEINTCKTDGNTDATCTDFPAPRIGFSCTCTGGFQSVGTSCVDVNYCVTGPQAPCKDRGDSNAKCTEVDATVGTGANTCTCTTGYEVLDTTVLGTTGGQTCEDKNNCKPANNLPGNPCNAIDEGAECSNKNPPSSPTEEDAYKAGYTCICTAGYERSGDATTCVDFDNCKLQLSPCAAGGDTNATCLNHAAGSNTTHACNCTAGYETNRDNTECKAPSNKPTNQNGGAGTGASASAGVVVAIVVAVLLCCILLAALTCFHRYKMREKDKKCSRIIGRADDHIMTMNASREFNELEMESGFTISNVIAIPDDTPSEAQQDRERRLEAEVRALREETTRHKKELAKKELQGTPSMGGMVPSPRSQAGAFASELAPSLRPDPVGFFA